MNIHFYEKNTISKSTTKRLKDLITKPLCKFKDKIKDVNINIQYFDLQQPQLLKSLKVVITLNSGKEYYFVKNHASILEASNRMRNLINKLMNSKSSDQVDKITASSC
jgi:hypothetical protein